MEEITTTKSTEPEYQKKIINRETGLHHVLSSLLFAGDTLNSYSYMYRGVDFAEDIRTDWLKSKFKKGRQL